MVMLSRTSSNSASVNILPSFRMQSLTSLAVMVTFGSSPSIFGRSVIFVSNSRSIAIEVPAEKRRV